MNDQGQQVGDRRPIAARELGVSKQIARQLAARGVTANAISAVGMLCGISAGIAFSLTSLWPEFARLWWFVAAGLIQLRLAANMFDGMVAIETRTASPVGELYNEVPDRISDSATLIGLGYAAGGLPVLGFIAALLAVFTAYVRAVGKVAGAPQDYSGPMAKQQRMFVATLAALYCSLLPAAWQPQWSAESSYSVAAGALVIIIVGSIVTSIRRLLRTAANLRKAKS